MPTTRIARRRPNPAATFFRTPLFPPLFPSRFPSFTDEELTERTNELMQSAFAGFPEFIPAERFPALNVSESKDEFIVSAELPGMTTKDVNIDYCDGVLTISGDKEHEETKEEEGKKFYMWERQFGSFQRALPFPGGIAEDKITAAFKDGVLTVHLPKAEVEKTNRRPIPISEK